MSSSDGMSKLMGKVAQLQGKKLDKGPDKKGTTTSRPVGMAEQIARFADEKRNGKSTK